MGAILRGENFREGNYPLEQFPGGVIWVSILLDPYTYISSGIDKGNQAMPFLFAKPNQTLVVF